MLKTGPRILCVDDDVTNLSLQEALLVPSGYEVILAETGGAALEIINHQNIDLVLLDVSMPDLNGFEVCRRIKDDERYQSIPIIMVTGLTSKEDRIKGIEAGAEDFISKPFDQTELLTRIKMLLKMKNLHDNLDSAYSKITDLIDFGKRVVTSFDPMHFNFISSFDDVVDNIMRRTAGAADKPQKVLVGFIDEKSVWQWYLFESLSMSIGRTWLKLDIHNSLNLPGKTDRGGMKTFFYNNADLFEAGIWPFIVKLEQISIKVSNMVCFMENSFCIFALNYDEKVTRYDAEVLNSIAMQSLFMKSLASQVRETEHSFDYLVHALARASEANDEDTGNHILRVGEYCAVTAKELDLPETFTNDIRVQATLHDLGKIHVHPDILKKAGKLTPEEYETIKQHTISGAKILGDHVRLAMAKKMILSHHERWDGSGYPYGLKGGEIPLEGRILSIADQYDALRNARVYKPAIEHTKTFGIITEGDGRTLPQHFDPQVLNAFRNAASRFEEIYEKMKG